MRFNHTNARYGKLTVLKPAPDDASGRGRWLCRCDCGREKIIHTKNLRSTKSCGVCRRGPQQLMQPSTTPSTTASDLVITLADAARAAGITEQELFDRLLKRAA